MKTSRSARVRIILLLVVVVGVAVCTFLSQPMWLFYRGEFKTGNAIISRVEAFRASHGHLPETLEDVGLTDPDLSVYYQKDNDNEYVVWFGMALGESEIYDSRTKKWQ